MFSVPAPLLRQTFEHFRQCGEGRRECQVLWVSPWASRDRISAVVHSRHGAHFGGFAVESSWINFLWNELARTATGIRLQVHTHPREAFHSPIDDAYPIIPSAGFFSLVIPNFGMGSVGFSEAYLARLGENGKWTQVPIEDHLRVV